MKKLIALLFVFGFIVFSAPQVHASVLSDALLKIQNLQKEVLQLKTQIGAAVYSSRYNSYLGGTSSGATSGSTSGTTTDCQSGEIFSYSTGQRCPTTSATTSAPLSACVDSDGGDDPYTAGKTTLSVYNPQTIPVSSDICYDSLTNVHSNSCSGAGCQVMENICVDTNNDGAKDTYNSHYDTCSNGCSNGACIQTTTVTIAPSILLKSSLPINENGTQVIMKLGDSITFTGIPSNLSGQVGVDYNRSFNFDPIFNDVCNQNTSSDWAQTCIPKSAGVGSFYVKVIKNGQEYNSNVIKVMVVANATTVDNGCANGVVYSYTTGAKCPSVSVPVITVLTPNGGEGYYPYDEMTVKWSSNTISSNSLVNIYLVNTSTNLETPLISNTPNDGVQSTVLADKATFGNDYKIKIVASNGISDTSDSYFKIYQETTPSIIVLSPNGGEIYQAGEKITVKWSSSGISSDAKLELNVSEKDGKIFGFLGKDFGTVNDGIEVIDTTGWPASSGYKIIVGIPFNNQFNNSNLVTSDESDNYFSIHAYSTDTGCSNGVKYNLNTGQVCPIAYPVTDIGCSGGALYSNTTGSKCPVVTTTIPSIQVLTPNGGEVYYLGEGIEKVKIVSSKIGTLSIYLVENPSVNDPGFKSFLASDGGNYFGRIDEGIRSFGSFTSGLIKSGKYYVMAEWKSDDGLENLVDFSDKSFTIKLYTGCENGAVYNRTTWEKCSVPTVIDMGCQSGEVFSSKTGQKCGSGFTTVDIGCSGGAIYSNTTGQVCPVDNNVTTTPITRTLKQGVIGDDVKTLQEFLGLKTDGVYGRGTAVKVKEWQRLNGLNPDGAFGNMSRIKAGLEN